MRLMAPRVRGSGRALECVPAGERYYVPLDAGSFDDYLQGMSAQRRKRIFYYRRKLEREGGLEERRVSSGEDIRLFLQETARLNRLRRNSQGKASAFSSAKFRRFQALVAPRLWQRGWLDLRLWLKDGRCVAALYGFVYARVIYYYQSGWDTAAFGNVSPGLVFLSQMIERGFASACAASTFWWAARDRTSTNTSAARNRCPTCGCTTTPGPASWCGRPVGYGNCCARWPRLTPAARV